jgi:hypothetical protein
MEHIINKLSKIEDVKDLWKNWSSEEIKQLLDIYLIISKKEKHIFNMIDFYLLPCDSFEHSFQDIFYNYDKVYLEKKATGVEYCINEIAILNELAEKLRRIKNEKK